MLHAGHRRAVSRGSVVLPDDTAAPPRLYIAHVAQRAGIAHGRARLVDTDDATHRAFRGNGSHHAVFVHVLYQHPAGAVAGIHRSPAVIPQDTAYFQIGGFRARSDSAGIVAQGDHRLYAVVAACQAAHSGISISKNLRRIQTAGHNTRVFAHNASHRAAGRNRQLGRGCHQAVKIGNIRGMRRGPHSTGPDRPGVFCGDAAHYSTFGGRTHHRHAQDYILHHPGVFRKKARLLLGRGQNQSPNFLLISLIGTGKRRYRLRYSFLPDPADGLMIVIYSFRAGIHPKINRVRLGEHVRQIIGAAGALSDVSQLTWGTHLIGMGNASEGPGTYGGGIAEMRIEFYRRVKARGNGRLVSVLIVHRPVALHRHGIVSAAAYMKPIQRIRMQGDLVIGDPVFLDNSDLKIGFIQVKRIGLRCHLYGEFGVAGIGYSVVGGCDFEGKNRILFVVLAEGTVIELQTVRFVVFKMIGLKGREGKDIPLAISGCIFFQGRGKRAVCAVLLFIPAPDGQIGRRQLFDFRPFPVMLHADELGIGVPLGIRAVFPRLHPDVRVKSRIINKGIAVKLGHSRIGQAFRRIGIS